MKIKEYLKISKLSAKSIAYRIGVSDSYFSQMLCGKRPWAVKYCVAIERETLGAVTRRELRPHDWQTLWPELIKQAL